MLITMAANLAGISGLAVDASEARGAAIALFKRIDRGSLIDPTSPDGERLPEVCGAIEFVDVDFAYPTRKAAPVCRGLSLSVAAGQAVALCGPSGCGKSTLVQLLERFYDPDAGSITFDGVDLRRLNLRWLRSQIGLVGQEPVLFVGTVAENIGYGKEGATQSEIEAAARAANAHTFITEGLPGGYGTQVGQGGGKLSGGQKQRVAIARALVKQPALLLLDEATSALDNESERVVQAAIDAALARERRTSITIAHRLSTIRHADKIAVIEEGRVVEEGTHDELFRAGGAYRRLQCGGR